MTASSALLVVAVFLASAVEMVEAATIVVAVGVTRGWRAALLGVGAGLLALGVVVAILGPALTAIPLSALRLFVGGLLLVFGLGWLRKAILRAAGLKALHDEEATFHAERERAREAVVAAGGLDTYGFTVSFKGVLLEGLEVAFIVVTFGTNQGKIGLAVLGAAAAVVVVLAAVVAVRGPLSRVPENTMKFVVGTLLTSFGMFWGAEGAGVEWPGGDVALAVIIPGTFLVGVALVAVVRRSVPTGRLSRQGAA
ncbi:MAG: COG4280 domain-containing protein [Candidatus Dormibacteria bacterium]